MVDLTFRWLITDQLACKPPINPRRYQLGGAGGRRDGNTNVTHENVTPAIFATID
jgi:hypothetical protein